MEISVGLKNDIKTIQGEITKAIHDHQNLALKLKDCPCLESQIKEDLVGIQKHIVELNEKQKGLLQLLRKEIEENITTSQFVPVVNFNLYKIKPGQLESKKRRRKDLSLAPKVVSCRPTHSSPSLSPSPTPSSSSSLSDESIDYVSPFMLPVPVPKPRPLLLPDVKENYLGGVSRRDLRPPKLKRNQKQLLDEEAYKELPVYYDPLPSPPPTDEKDLKTRFMTALSLIPKEMLNEILNRKVERKRRSTATNNPNFVYNNDWEIPVWKRSRTYLSPHKLGKLDVPGKKIKSEDGSDGVLPARHTRKYRDESGRLYHVDGLSGEKFEVKSRNSTPDSTGSNLLCYICHTSGPMNTCKDCNICFHSSCVSPGSLMCCTYCKRKRLSPDDGSSEDSGKEEFASKCPNVAESYSKLKEYIENHTDSDTAALYAERENFKMELMAKNQELYGQKRELEEKAAELSEALLLQEDAKNNLLKEEETLLKKIRVIVDFVTVYQKTIEKKTKEMCDKEQAEEGEISKNETVENDPHSNDENHGDGYVKGTVKGDTQGSCESPASWKDGCNNFQSYSPEPTVSQESAGNSPRTIDNFDSSSQMSKESANDVTTMDAYGTPPPKSFKDDRAMAYDSCEGDDQLTSQSIECSAESEGIEYEDEGID
ncbi:hypothetical protein RUM43_013293 [Polyplax serrata]|uniref:PHD finger protein 21A n=1 Tax=Polyplax serrata TaxID=468196 RepID=A0AAN8PHA4_POLSC